MQFHQIGKANPCYHGYKAKDSSDVLPCLPPKLEPLFRIKLIQGTQPIFRSPYRMVAIEQKELKKQIGDLIAKGFIRQVSCFEQL